MRTFEEIKNTIETGLGMHVCDLKIENVKLVNVFSGEVYPTNIYIKNKRIVSIDPSADLEAKKVLDGNGQYALPGLIDAHVHLFQHGSGFGMDADRLLSAGVTTAVDMGSAGYANFAAMHQCDLAGKKLRLKSFLNLSPIGQPGKGINEPLGDDVLSIEKMQEMMEQYPGEIAGVKVRISRPIVGELGLQPLQIGRAHV